MSQARGDDFAGTLCLPRTDFPMRARLAEREPELLARWAADDLEGARARARRHRPPFVLHDGPPYANGAIHHGHILNKLLKDFVLKDRSMANMHVRLVPGWDCHGLPIEQQVDRQLGAGAKTMAAGDKHAACRRWAEQQVDGQRQAMRRLGVLATWDDPYLTMDPAYEATCVEALADLVDTGLCYRGLRPTHWCRVHQTALAEAEVEYETVDSPSAYVALALLPPAAAALGLPEGADLLVWTTTPWSLPANRAVAVHPDLAYVAARIAGRWRLVAEVLLPAVAAALGVPVPAGDDLRAPIDGRTLAAHGHYQHPFLARTGPVLCADHVSAEAGTGLVHTAPAHGVDDFALGQAHHLPLEGPIDGAGCFTDAAGPQLAGQRHDQAVPIILRNLHERGALLSSPTARVGHRFPHCWRCHTALLTRTTEQWFVAMDRPFGGGGTLRERAVASCASITWWPPAGRERMLGMVRARPDWCLSRQRVWGVPIPWVRCAACDAAVVDSARMRRVAAAIRADSAAAWFTQPLGEIWGTPAPCARCGGHEMVRGGDILDVWFESGISFAAVIGARGLARPEGRPIDLVVEGSDQHRGWFHTQLLLGLATGGAPPYRQVLTHGFVVDAAGKKISKSRGNYVDPAQAIAREGAEILRLWAAAEDHRDDLRLSDEILRRLGDAYRRVRNTLRFLLGALDGFRPGDHRVEAAALASIDSYALALTDQALARARAAMARYAFHQAWQAIVELCGQELSAFYLDVVKDRLYAAEAGGVPRRSAQTAIFHIARDLIRTLAPLASFTAEEAWGHLPRLPGDPASVHLALYPGLADEERACPIRRAVGEEGPALVGRWGPLRAVRRVVNIALEEARRAGTIRSGLGAVVTLELDAAMHEALRPWTPAELAECFIVAEVVLGEATAHTRAAVTASPHARCPRCWQHRAEVDSEAEARADRLCRRCRRLVA